MLGLPEVHGPGQAVGRDPPDDGHFLGVEATVTELNPIPELSTALLGALGLLGLRMGDPSGAPLEGLKVHPGTLFEGLKQIPPHKSLSGATTPRLSLVLLSLPQECALG